MPERRATTTSLRAALLAAAALTGACGPGGGPEQELRSLIDEAEAAAESRDTGHFRGLISRDYVDARGNSRDDLINWLRGYFLTHQRVEIVTRVEDIDVSRDEVANIGLAIVSMTWRGGERFGGFGGDVERIDLELVREAGGWRIIGASWR